MRCRSRARHVAESSLSAIQLRNPRRDLFVNRALEFGFTQSDAIRQLLAQWPNTEFHDDLAGIPRLALARSQHS